MRRLAALGGTLGLLLLAAPAAADPLTVMTFNVWYGGAQVEQDRIGQAIRAAGADVVGVQEPEGNLRRIAEVAGMSYTDETLHLISHYPIYAVERGGVRFAYVAVAPGRVVAIGNVHLPSSPYGPELVRDGKSRAEVLANERATRLGEIRPYLRPLSRQAGRGVPTFLTGDFNSPSHLDWTEAAAAARPQVKYSVRWPVSVALERAGFRDSYREVYPDPVARPGLTWTAGTPPPRIRRRETVDRIDWVTVNGPATTVTSRLVGEPGGPDVDIGLPWGSDHRAVASTFEVSAAPAPPLAHAEPRVVRRGERVAVRYIGARGAAKRVGILPAVGGRPIASLPIADTSDHRAVLFGTADLRPGAYRAALLSHGHVVAASRFWVLGRDERPRIRTSRGTYAPGETVGLRWSGMPGNRFDWVGIFKAGRTLDLYGYLGFSYIGALPSGRISMTTADLGRLAPGRYVAGLFLDDGYSLLARTSFRVKR
ncbi:MAG TPA: endonuclease/exonuclease/phosphatase family protein [Thermoleophilaceae bacterium]|jgi:endonuclease/exonuclease/phosphatase family metal-dependent hydrolase|nr:endonuclease/exonuclease/phosphatase family protein [Thermoleophilaceae bacterium]